MVIECVYLYQHKTEINKNCNWLINSNYTIISSPAYISKNEPAYVGDEAAGLNAP